MEERREERGIGEYGREEGRQRNREIWKRGGKREEYGNMEDMRDDKGILE